jgi:cytidine deaminase
MHDTNATTPGQRSDETVDAALSVAREARERSYVPYSGFRMGAAVVTDRGEIVPGTLVENVSLGLAMCAERIALFAAVARNAGTPRMLVLVAPRTSGELTRPCGACLQVALELGGPDLVVVVADSRDVRERTTVRTLAPSLPYKPDGAGKRIATALKTSLTDLKP